MKPHKILILAALALACTSDDSDPAIAYITDPITDETETGDDPLAPIDPTEPFETPICGNGVIEDGEHCDTEDLGGHDCASIGWTAGELGCSATCDLDASDCNLSCETATDCAESRPYCVASQCETGDEDAPCVNRLDCDTEFCTGGSCFDGSAGDPCGGEDDCGNYAPACVHALCQAGLRGSPCEDAADCLQLDCTAGVCGG
jgi:hypothetical protein